MGSEITEVIESAILAFREAEALGHTTAASNRGNALLRLGRCTGALAAHQSAIAHLAGAIGVPLWLLLLWQSGWRWRQDRLTTPWYPAVQIFRQTSHNNWPELIARIASQLPAFLAARQFGAIPRNSNRDFYGRHVRNWNHATNCSNAPPFNS